MKKQPYLSPQIEVIVMENESVIAGSLGGVTDGGTATRSISGRAATRNYNSASSSDLEDLINDILTVEQ